MQNACLLEWHRESITLILLEYLMNADFLRIYFFGELIVVFDERTKTNSCEVNRVVSDRAAEIQAAYHLEEAKRRSR